MPRRKRDAETDEMNQPKRRGRPKGSKNRAKKTGGASAASPRRRGRSPRPAPSLSERLASLAAELERLRAEVARLEQDARRAERIRELLAR